MSLLLVGSGALCLVGFAVHLFAGQRDIVRPMLQAAPGIVSERTLLACWHLVSVDLLHSGLVLLYLGAWAAPGTDSGVVRFIALRYLAYAVVFVGAALSKQWPRSLLLLPQWILMLLISIPLWL